MTTPTGIRRALDQATEAARAPLRTSPGPSANNVLMSDRYNRRTALAGFGGISLSALLAACGSDNDAASTPTAVETTGGTTSTVQTSTGSSGSSRDLVARFDAASACAQTTEQTEGPYFFEVDKIRHDIHEDREGATLRLGIRVRDLESCEPIPNAVVDVWHCDALGLYSGFESASQGGPGSGRSDDETYLRGAQVTSRDGIVDFRTIYPGWYRGRTTHIHTKVHMDASTLLTSQLYFDDDVTARVYENTPYASDAGRDAFNDNDPFYVPELEVTLSEEGDGWLGLITFDVRQA